MAKSAKRGLDYFPLDIDIFEEEKLFDVQNQYGAVGEVIYIRLLCLIYKNGYYYHFEELDRLCAMMIKSIGNRWIKEKSEVREIIEFLVECKLFDKAMFEQKVLTSRGIQKRFWSATERRRSDRIVEYSLIDDIIKKEMKKPKNNVVCNNGQNVDNNPENVCNRPQSKVKESKVKQSKAEESKVEYGSAGSFVQAQALCEQALTNEQTTLSNDKILTNEPTEISEKEFWEIHRQLNEEEMTANTFCEFPSMDDLSEPFLPKDALFFDDKPVDTSKVVKSFVIDIPCATPEYKYKLQQSDVERLQELFPSLRVSDSLNNMSRYFVMNPDKVKPYSAMKKYIELWLRGDEEKGRCRRVNTYEAAYDLDAYERMNPFE